MKIKSCILWLLLFLFSCQKDFYLDDLNEAQAEIERITAQKKELETRVTSLIQQNASILSQNNQLNQQLNELNTALEDARISLEVAEALLAEYSEQLALLGGIDDGIYKRKKIKIASSLAILDTLSFTIDDEVFTSHYQIEDSLITFWGVVQDSSAFNSLPFFQEYNYRNNYYTTRTVLDQRLINATDFKLVLDITNNPGEVDEEPLFAELILTPTTEIPFQRTNTELLEQYREMGTGIFSDSIYGAIDLFDPYSHLEGFIKDAARHGIDISHLTSDVFELVWEPDYYEYASGYAFNVCDANAVGVGLRQSDWNNEIVQDFNDYRLSLMWHEFGHSILGLHHLCQGGHIMTGRHQNPQTILSEEECASEHINIWGLSFDNPDSYRNFQRATKDMFEGYFQKQYDCSSGKYGIIYD